MIANTWRQLEEKCIRPKVLRPNTFSYSTRVLDKHIHPAHTFYMVLCHVNDYALHDEDDNEYA